MYGTQMLNNLIAVVCVRVQHNCQLKYIELR